MTTTSTRTIQLLLITLLQFVLSCGARTAPYIEERVLPQRVNPACPATIFAQVGELVDVRVTPVPDSPDIVYGWSLEEVPAALVFSIQLTEQTRTSAKVSSDHATTVIVRYWQRRRGRASEEANDTGYCGTKIIFRPDIELRCQASANGLLGENLLLPVQVSSRSGRPLTTRWSVYTRPVGGGLMSTSVPIPIDAIPARLLLDERGLYTVDVEVRNDLAHVERCRLAIGSSAEIGVVCPNNFRTPALQVTNLSPQEIRNPRNGELSFAGGWILEPVRPYLSRTDPLFMQLRDASFFMDVADHWITSFHVGLPGAGLGARCITHVDTYHDDDVHLELSWNVYSSGCVQCSGPGGGQHVSLQVTQATANNGVYPGQYQCVREGCSCIEGSGRDCAPNLVDWPPAGPINDPRLVFSNGCNRPGPEHIAIHRAQPGTEFDIAALYDRACLPAIRQFRTPVRATVRVFCGGQLRYETEDQEIPYLISGPGERPDFGAWRIGRLRYNADRTCTMTRHCPDGQPQDACIGRTQEIYETP